MNQTDYLNSPLKCCDTCIYRAPDPVLGRDPYWDTCSRFKTSCRLAMEFHCGYGLSEWRQKPPPAPKQSLRRWIYEKLWA